MAITDQSPQQHQGESGGDWTPVTFEYETLLSRCMGNHALMRRLLEKFSDSLEDDIALLRKYGETRRARQLAEKAHALKGSAASLSCEAIRQASERLELLAREENLDQTRQALSDISYAAERFIDEARGLLDRRRS